LYFLYALLTRRNFLRSLLLINVFGTVYGYLWYGSQLRETPARFLPFVPDSPTACLFFVFVLIAFLSGKHWGVMEALALMTLFKYGIWAVVMNLLSWKVAGFLPWEGWMLIFSHLGMALEGLAFAPFYRIRIGHLLFASLWSLHNDVIDYVFLMYPRYRELDGYVAEIGYFTFWLSLVSIAVTYYFGCKMKRMEL